MEKTLQAMPTDASATAEPAQFYKSAHLLAQAFANTPSEMQTFSDVLDPLHALSLEDMAASKTILAALNRAILQVAEKDSIQPSGMLTAPASGAQPAVNLYTFYPDHRCAKSPVIYFMHSGGYVIGNARQDNARLFALAKQTGAVVVSVEYRLACEAPFPADIDDAYHGLAYVFEHANELGFDKDNIILMGESAGGGLAARLALKIRDIGKYAPKGQVLIFPMLDCRTGTDASPYHNVYAGEFFWTAQMNCVAWAMLKGGQAIADSQMPYFSPSMAGDLRHLPRAYVMVGSLDLFVHEAMDYASRLIAAGVPTDLQVIDGVPHCFQQLQSESSQTLAYEQARNDAIARMFA